MRRAPRLPAFDTCAALAALLATAACVPESYDGLTGGTKDAPLVEDASLGAPRPLSPISVSMVSTSRPKFRWELAETEGAVLELCRSRACDGEMPKRFVANGQELSVPEDLAPGMWFWRVRGRTGDRMGTDTSPTWEVLVRGPAAHGSSDAPTGSVLDLDGDGAPDLVASVLAPSEPGSPMGAPLFPWIAAYRGGADGRLRTDDYAMVGTWSSRGEAYFERAGARTPVALAGGTDFNGDGFADFTAAGTDVYETPDGPLYTIEVDFGSKDGAADGYVLDLSGSIYPGVLATLKEAGDVNADGYGDLTIGSDDAGYLVLGASLGPSASTVLFPSAPSAMGARAVLGGFDADGDGLGEIAIATPDPGTAGARRSYTSPLARMLAPSPLASAVEAPTMPLDRSLDGQLALVARGGERSSTASLHGLRAKTHSAGAAPSARAFAAGDFNGDALSDVAVADGSGHVCFWFGDRAKLLTAAACASGLDGDTSFGAALTAADLDGDGVDELVASAVTGDRTALRTIALDGATAKVAAVPGTEGLGARLTTIWPGRPGNARWAAASTDGTKVVVFDGTARLQVLDRPDPSAAAFGAALR